MNTRKILQAIAIAVGIFLTGIGGSLTVMCLQQVPFSLGMCVPSAGLTLVGVVLIIIGFYA